MSTRILFSSRHTGLGAFAQDGEKYAKDFLCVGTWYVTTPAGERIAWPVTRDRIANWAKNFKLFRERGISVPLSVDHIRVTDAAGTVKHRKLTPAMAEAKRGEIAHIYLDGDKAMCHAAPADDAARELMNRCPEVSVEIERDLVDAHGHYYDEAVTAITLTPIPQIPGQQMVWEPVEEAAMAASRGAQETLLADFQVSPTQENRMDPILLARLRTLTGLKTETEDAVLAKVAELAETREAAITSAVTAAITPLTDKNITLSRDLAVAKAGTSVVTVEDLAKSVDEDALDMAASGIEARINALSLSRKITPTQKTLLMSKLVGKAGSRNVIALSRKTASKVGLPDTLSAMVLEVFEAGDVVEMQAMLKEQSKGQRTVLSREVVTGDEAAPEYDPNLTKTMIENANSAVKAQGAFQM